MEGTCVLIAVLAIALVTAVGDFQKERQFRALNAVNENELVRVVRFGAQEEEENDSRVRKWSLVVSDIVQLEPGDVTPTDGIAFRTDLEKKKKRMTTRRRTARFKKEATSL
ncbi:Calcium-transporting ATPase 2 [Phytophthora citrophthora]|uniref:Calcium-transporting ATPase 2 n=1 Tax=Phytophthora citrophthora TaxID=4793 RepID=A0AAD9GEE5_9STRA|nr:Calcium-transporting ATPase 2 [Phytophthora citrophthora]